MAESWEPGSSFMNISQLNVWLKCRYLWHLVYVMLVQPRHERPAISLGSCTHEIIAAYLKGEDPTKGFDEFDKQYSQVELTIEEEIIKTEIENTAWMIAQRVIKEIDLGHKWETVVFNNVKLVEKKFRLAESIGPFEGFQGYTDWVGRELEHGREWLVDWKVRKAFQPIEAEEFSMQMAGYTYMLRRKGLHPVGSMTWQLKAAAPKVPKENKPTKHGRSLSRQLILTDWETYCNAILAIDGNPDDYLDVRVKLDEVEWSRQSRAFWSDEVLKGLWSEIRKITKTIGTGDFNRSFSYMACNSCRLKDLCVANVRGDDTDFLMKTQFQIRGEKPRTLPVLVDDDEAATGE